MIDKSRLLDALRAHIASDLEALERRQRDAQAGSTHEESRAEHAKDTRATEQSYLARGLADRAEDLRRTSAALASMRVEALSDDDPIAVGALVTIAVYPDPSAAPGAKEADEAEDDGDEQTWWLVAWSGGVQLPTSDGLVRTFAVGSPLGRALLSLHTGDEGAWATPRGTKRFEVLGVG